MKRFLSCISIALCAAVCSVFLAACGSNSHWLTPEFVYDGDEFTIEFVTNLEKDFEFPIANKKLDHSNFAGEYRLVEYAWIIYNTEHELVGWIEAGGGYETNKKNDLTHFGYSAGYNNGVYSYSSNSITVVLKDTNLSIFDSLNLTSDIGTVEKLNADHNPAHGPDVFFQYDQATGESTPYAGSENFVCCNYTLDLSNVDPYGPRTITFTLSFKSE